MNFHQLTASQPGPLVVFSDCELGGRIRKKIYPHDLSSTRASCKFLTFKSCSKKPSYSLSVFPNRSTLLSSRPTFPLFTWSGRERHLFKDSRAISLAPQSRPGNTSITTHFIGVAKPEELEMEPQMDVKVSTFAYKERETISVRVLREMGFYQVEISLREEDMTLHWGVEEWSFPDKNWWPDSTVTLERAKALETSFMFVCQDHWQVLMRFSEMAAPKQLVFVLRDKAGMWYNNGGCFCVMVKPLEMKDLMNKIVVPETSYSNWSLFSRFILASSLLDSAEALGGEGMALVYTWLRFSQNKQLGWYRNCNYQSKDIAHVQETLASLMAEKVKRGNSSLVRLFARMSLSTLPRGGGDSEQIRMGILNIMREHGIREGHRPGLEERFLEQWHQKLHTNTSPEDIHICEAYLEFLQTKSMDAFYRTLWARGGVTREWLENMDHPINAAPLFLPQLIPAFKHFLWVLKTVHSGADLDVALEMSKKYLDDDLKGLLYHVLGNRNEWWIPGKVVEARKRLEHVCRADWSSRDVLMLDIALESFFGLSISRIEKSSLSGDDICELISLVLENACINADCSELSMCTNLWSKVKGTNRWTQEWALLALAAVDRISQALQGYVDKIYKVVQPQAETLGKLCGIGTSYLYAFGEEVVRGQSIFNLSVLLQKLQPMLRATACVGSWQIASHQATARGTLMVLPSLASIQGHAFPSPRVVIIDSIGGLEDIPVGVTAVLSSSTTDILSHVSIRARNNKVLLASCSDKEEFGTLKMMEGKTVVVAVHSTGNISVAEPDNFLEPVQTYSPTEMKNKDKKANRAPPITNRVSPALPSDWVITEDNYEESQVGGKSYNIAKLRKLLPKEIHLPASIVLPLGTFERLLNDPLNDMAASLLTKAFEELDAAAKKSNTTIPNELAIIRKIVGSKLSAPEVMKNAISAAAEASGLIEPGGWNGLLVWESNWRAICKVWASKWTARAWLSRRAMGLPENAVFMGCLLQKVVPAEYAFVIHTVHPTTKNKSEMFCEVVPGLGEVLVGNYSGNALSFTILKEDRAKPNITSLPSKAAAYYASTECLIARSDSNGEDLETFAGAGLYDSVIANPPRRILVDYSEERLMWDIKFREKLIQDIRNVGLFVEAALGGQPQDIEGTYRNGEITVVQARPQIL